MDKAIWPKRLGTTRRNFSTTFCSSTGSPSESSTVTMLVRRSTKSSTDSPSWKEMASNSFRSCYALDL
uniref:Uncharacterized protein n=1 Tax=Arundo donax TaxID=35708 RepID=A0A0A8YBM4_ARUDO